MGTTIGIIGLFVAIALLVVLAFKGHSVIIAAPIAALIAVLFSYGLKGHFMASYTITYMSGFANYAKNYFPIYLFGAVFAKLMDISGNAQSIAQFCTLKLGKSRAVLSVVLTCAILTYGGVSLFVVAFVMLPVAIAVFRAADIPKRLIPGAIALGAFTFTMTALPGSPQVQNTIPMTYFGTDSWAAPVLGIIATVIMFGGGMAWLSYRTNKAKKAGEGYGNYQDKIVSDNKEVPGIGLAFAPILIILVVNLVLSKMVYPNVDGSYLEESFNSTLAANSGTWSVLLGMLVAILFIAAVNFSKLKDGLKDNLKKLYFKFLIPSLGSAMVMSIYTLTDAIVIGKGVGADALAALSITTPLLCILMSTGILFGVGGSVQMSVHRGSGNHQKSNRYFTISFFLITAVTTLLWLIYATCMPKLLHLMGANDTLFPYAMSYMRYINIFLPVAVFSNYVAIFIRADNDPNRAMAGVLLGGVVNIALDIIFVFPMHMGMGGAAFASVLGMTIQVIVGGSHFFSRKNGLHFIRPIHTIPSIRHIIVGGIPSFFNEFANGFIVLLFNIQILKYCGENALSIYSVISNCVILFNSLFTGVGQSIQPVISTNYGAGNGVRIKGIKKMAYTTILIMGAIFSLSGILFPTAVCRIFIKMNPTLTDIANLGIRTYFFAFLPFGINLLTSYYLQAILRSAQSLCISLLRNIILSSICILVFPLCLGASSLWFVMPIVEVVVLFVSLGYLKSKSI